MCESEREVHWIQCKREGAVENQNAVDGTQLEGDESLEGKSK